MLLKGQPFFYCKFATSLNNNTMRWLSLIQQVNIPEKVKQAPDGSYQMGVVIGTFIPFVFFAALAYWMYYKAKKRDKFD